jgi:hypothetical protein
MLAGLDRNQGIRRAVPLRRALPGPREIFLLLSGSEERNDEIPLFAHEIICSPKFFISLSAFNIRLSTVADRLVRPYDR